VDVTSFDFAPDRLRNGEGEERLPFTILFKSWNTTATTVHDGHDGLPQGLPSCPSWSFVTVVFPALAEQELLVVLHHSV
jgi:hypothetical protein